ncbi:hypothetical protein Tco_0865973, partial [Tanacetum coccineum]
MEKERYLSSVNQIQKVNERQIQTTEEKTDTSNALDALDASSVIIESNGTESKADTSRAEQGFRKVDQNAEQCHDIRPLPAKLTDDKTIELSDQSLESENVCLKKIVAQFQKYFGKLEAHCVKNDIDVIETINIELEHSVAKLLAENEQLHKENEHLKQTYKDLFDSIKRTRVQTKNQNDSLMEQLNKKSNENADVLAQIQKKGFAIAALKNELRKLTGNSVHTKFAKPSKKILGKPVGQPLKNQSVVRQPTAFKSERPRISKPRFASQVDVNNDLSKPVTTHHLPKGRESAPAKPHHMIAPSSSRGRTPSLVAKKKDISENRASRNSEFKTTAITAQVQSWYQKFVLSSQDSYIKTRVGITIPPSYINAEDNRSELFLQDIPISLAQEKGQ